MDVKLSPLETIATDWRHCFTSMWSVQLEPVETLSLTETDPGIEPLAAILVFPLADSRSLEAHLDTLASTRGTGIQRSAVQTYQLDQALLPAMLTNLLEEIHVQVDEDLLILSDQFRGIHQVTRRRHLGQNLRKRSDVQRLMAHLPSPEAGLAFIDAEPVLTRGTEALQHPLVFAILWMGICS